ncbi:MAG: hypothetical protein KME31_32810 [Tolypothrix carrinoi HA7290-LM1]|jgi:hypothetical protein|nr:hypothetical protein [Tolypothrix carrinoi HA7290-LM1]
MLETLSNSTHKIPALSEHSKAGIALILSNSIWWVIAANPVPPSFRLFFGVLTFILNLVTAYKALKLYRSPLQNKFTEASTLNLIWMIALTILVENCFFDFENRQRLIISFIFGGIATVALFVDIFRQFALYKVLLIPRQNSGQKLWSIEMAMSVGIIGNILQIIALYTLIRYPFINQFSWKDYPDQSWFIFNAWHLTVSISIFNLPVLSLYNLKKISQNVVNSYLLFTGLLSILFCVACIFMKVKWFF